MFCKFVQKLEIKITSYSYVKFFIKELKDQKF